MAALTGAIAGEKPVDQVIRNATRRFDMGASQLAGEVWI
jgi:hypothetical protein